MTTNYTADEFTTAARAEAQCAYQNTGMPRYDLAIHMAAWARDHLAAQEDDGHDGWCGCGCQEPTDAEVEAAAAVLFRRRTGNDWTEAREEIRGLWRNDARAVLTAAKEARHG